METMTPHVLLDEQGTELGRIGVEAGISFRAGQRVDLGPVGYYRVLGVRDESQPVALIVEPTERIPPGAPMHGDRAA